MATIILALLEHSEQADMVKDCLSQAGHDVHAVDTFSKAKLSLKTGSFDLIISDAHLENGGSVFDFLRWTKSQPHLKSIPFVLFSLEPTGIAKYLSDGVRTTARLFGAARYITMDKFDADILHNTIAELLPDADQTAPPGTRIK